MSVLTPIIWPVMGKIISSFWGLDDLPPNLSGKLLAYFSGVNTDAAHKTELVNEYDMTAVEGPCLTLKLNDTMYLPLDDTIASNIGTAIMSYDGETATVTTPGTIYGVISGNGLVFPFCEGGGNKVRDTTSKNELTITAASPDTMWTENTQDDYFFAMSNGWYEPDPPDGNQYPYDPDIEPYWTLHMVVTGLGSITINGTPYEVGVHNIEGLVGTVDMTAAYAGGSDAFEWSGDAVGGSFPNYSIDMFSHHSITGAFSVSGAQVEYRDSTELSDTVSHFTSTISTPAGVVDGDIMILTVQEDTVGNTLTLPLGWAKIAAPNGNAAFTGSVAYKIAASEPATYDVTSTKFGRRTLTLNVFSKPSGTWAVPTAVVTNSTTITTTATPVSGVDDNMLFAVFMNDADLTVTVPPIDMTLSSSAAVSSTINVNYYEQTTEQLYTKSVTWSSSAPSSVVTIILGVA